MHIKDFRLNELGEDAKKSRLRKKRETNKNARTGVELDWPRKDAGVANRKLYPSANWAIQMRKKTGVDARCILIEFRSDQIDARDYEAYQSHRIEP